jgi:hypothetical protein
MPRLALECRLRLARASHAAPANPVDRIYLAILASALLLLVVATGLYVTRTADLLPHAGTVGFSGSS